MVFAEVETVDEAGESSTILKAYVSTQGGRVISFDPVTHRFLPNEFNPSEIIIGRPTLKVSGLARDIRFQLPEDAPHLGSVDIVDEAYYGIKSLSTPYDTPSEIWTLSSGGALPGTRRTTGRILEENLRFHDNGARYCEWGVEAGDILEIVMGENISCGDLVGTEFRVQLTKVASDTLDFDPASLRVKAAGDDAFSASDSTLGLTPQCLAGPLNYQIRVPEDVFLVNGSRSGVLHPWEAGSDGCVDSGNGYTARASVGLIKDDEPLTCPINSSDADLVPFENPLFSFALVPGCTTTPEGIVLSELSPDTIYRFTISGGNVPQTILSTSRNADLLVHPNQKQLYHLDDGVNAIYVLDPADDTLDSTIY